MSISKLDKGSFETTPPANSFSQESPSLVESAFRRALRHSIEESINTLRSLGWSYEVIRVALSESAGFQVEVSTVITFHENYKRRMKEPFEASSMSSRLAEKEWKPAPVQGSLFPLSGPLPGEEDIYLSNEVPIDMKEEAKVMEGGPTHLVIDTLAGDFNIVNNSQKR